MSLSITDLLKPLTLEQLNQLKEKLGFNLKASTKKELVPSLSRAIRRHNVPVSTLIKEIDKIRHPSPKKFGKQAEKEAKKRKSQREVEKILKILRLVEVDKPIYREAENILKNNVRTALTVKGYTDRMRETPYTMPVTDAVQSYFPDFSIDGTEIAIELKAVKNKREWRDAKSQASEYKKKYRHVIVFLYDFGRGGKLTTSVIPSDKSFKKEIENLGKRNIYVLVKQHRMLKKKEDILQKVQQSEKSRETMKGLSTEIRISKKS